MQVPNIPGTGSHVRFPLLSSHLRLSQGQGQVFMFRNKASFLLWDVFSSSPNPEAGGPTLVSCHWLLI
jgi:hypothetical protein